MSCYCKPIRSYLSSYIGCVLEHWAVIALHYYSPKVEHDGDRHLERRPRRTQMLNYMMHEDDWILDLSACCQAGHSWKSIFHAHRSHKKNFRQQESSNNITTTGRPRTELSRAQTKKNDHIHFKYLLEARKWLFHQAHQISMMPYLDCPDPGSIGIQTISVEILELHRRRA